MKWEQLLKTFVMTIERGGGSAQYGGRWPALKLSFNKCVVGGGVMWDVIAITDRRFRRLQKEGLQLRNISESKWLSLFRQTRGWAKLTVKSEVRIMRTRVKESEMAHARQQQMI